MNLKLSMMILLTLTHAWLAAEAHLHRLSAVRPVPEQAAGIYAPPVYEKWQAFHLEYYGFSVFSVCLQYALLALLLLAEPLTACFSRFPHTLPGIMASSALLFSGLFLYFSLIFLRSFRIRGKYGFGTFSRKDYPAFLVLLFLLLQILSAALSILLFLSTERGVFRNPPSPVLWCLGGWGLVTVYASLLPSLFVLPRARKLAPGRLSAELEEMLKKQGVHHCSILVYSDPARKAGSACMLRLLNRRFILLSERLLETRTTEEIRGITAHEIGRILQGGSVFRELLYHLFTLLGCFLSWIAVNALCRYAGAPDAGIFLLPWELFTLSAGLVIMLVARACVLNAFTRREIFAADAFAAGAGYGDALILSLRHLAADEFEELNPHPVYQKLCMKYPTLSQRTEAIRRIQESAGS